MTKQPVLFLSHGAPSLALVDGPARRFLKALAHDLPRPDAILIASAHNMARTPGVASAQKWSALHDFGGFDPALSRLSYSPPGADILADRAVELLRGAGVVTARQTRQQLDHGAWVPLSLIWPDARIPVATLALLPWSDEALHLRMGAALAPLRRDNVLIIGSGSATHNLYAADFRTADAPEQQVARDFADWLASTIERGDTDALTTWRDHPAGLASHPTPDHLLPLFIAAGAGASTGHGAGQRIHTSTTYGALAMDAFRWD